jgi:hypothetical protein
MYLMRLGADRRAGPATLNATALPTECGWVAKTEYIGFEDRIAHWSVSKLGRDTRS